MRTQAKLALVISIALVGIIFFQVLAADKDTNSSANFAKKIEAVQTEKLVSGGRIIYTKGTIKPDHISHDQMNATVLRLYNEWKNKYLKKNPHAPSQYYVWYSDGDFIENNAVTVSEAHGYGMLLTVLMADQDPNAQACFDGLYQFYKAHPSQNNRVLMAWQQADNGSALVDVGGPESATDGDMDIAYALVLADKQWGSSGNINYLSQAKKIINAIMESDVNQEEWILKLGDWSSDRDLSTRSSDFMLHHLKVFAMVTGDGRWNRVVDKTYGIMEYIFENYSQGTGLLPDFIIKEKGSYQPVQPNYLESDFDGDYYYNACRFPWRVATDYLMTGDDRAKLQLTQFNSWVEAKTNGVPLNFNTGYTLDGKCIESDMDLSFSAPLMVSAMISSDNQKWLNDLWKYNMSFQTSEQFYYGNTLRLLCSIVVSGNWK